MSPGGTLVYTLTHVSRARSGTVRSRGYNRPQSPPPPPAPRTPTPLPSYPRGKSSTTLTPCPSGSSPGSRVPVPVRPGWWWSDERDRTSAGFLHDTRVGPLSPTVTPSWTSSIGTCRSTPPRLVGPTPTSGTDTRDRGGPTEVSVAEHLPRRGSCTAKSTVTRPPRTHPGGAGPSHTIVTHATVDPTVRTDTSRDRTTTRAGVWSWVGWCRAV